MKIKKMMKKKTERKKEEEGGLAGRTRRRVGGRGTGGIGTRSYTCGVKAEAWWDGDGGRHTKARLTECKYKQQTNEMRNTCFLSLL